MAEQHQAGELAPHMRQAGFTGRPDAAAAIAAAALAWLLAAPGQAALDLGTGSGDLALALLAARPGLAVTGLDFSATNIATATARGSAARFINHSCKPNLRKAAMDWAGLECGPLLYLCAARDIAPGEELTWNYFEGAQQKEKTGFECSCLACTRAAARRAGAASPGNAEGGRRRRAAAAPCAGDMGE